MLYLSLFFGAIALYMNCGKRPLRRRLMWLSANAKWEAFNDLIIRYKRFYSLDSNLRWANFFAKANEGDISEMKEAAKATIYANAENIAILKMHENVERSECLGFVVAQEADDLDDLVEIAQKQLCKDNEKKIRSIDLEVINHAKRDSLFANYLISKIESEDYTVHILRIGEDYKGFFVVFDELYEEHIS